jgi:hypothetical protein
MGQAPPSQGTTKPEERPASEGEPYEDKFEKPQV